MELIEEAPLTEHFTVADPGFPVGGGGGGRRPVGGHQPPTHTLFSKNICENERN